MMLEYNKLFSIVLFSLFAACAQTSTSDQPLVPEVTPEATVFVTPPGYANVARIKDGQVTCYLYHGFGISCIRE